jgi:hypothetical protein
VGSRENAREQCSRTSLTEKGPCSTPVAISAACDQMPKASTYRDQLKRLKVAVAAAARAPERLLNAQTSRAYAVRDVDDAREFLQLPKQLLGDECVIGGPVHERLLRRIAADSSQRGEYHEIVEKKAQSSGHGSGLSHIPGCVWRRVLNGVRVRGEVTAGRGVLGVARHQAHYITAQQMHACDLLTIVP